MTNQYVGCYLDCENGLRDINSINTDLDVLSPFNIETCIDFCLKSGYIYAAVQDG